jgi:hypothetical protein
LRTQHSNVISKTHLKASLFSLHFFFPQNCFECLANHFTFILRFFFKIFLRRNLLLFQTIFGSKFRAQPRRMRSTSVRVVSSQGVLRSQGSHPVQGLELAEGARGEQNRGAKVARLEIEITGKLSFLCI